MFQVPENYRDLATRRERITPGGHKCVIKDAVEELSTNGNPMITVYFDTDMNDTQPKYFENDYLNNKKTDKKWRGVLRTTLSGDYGNVNLARLCTAAEDSNPGWVCKDANGYFKTTELKGKKIGVVFREEESQNEAGKFYVNSFRFCNYTEAFEQEVPKRKELNANQPTTAADFGFVNIVDGLDDVDGLPFK